MCLDAAVDLAYILDLGEDFEIWCNQEANRYKGPTAQVFIQILFS